MPVQGANVPHAEKIGSDPRAVNDLTRNADDEIAAETLRLLYRQAPAGVLGSLSVGSVLVVALAGDTPVRWLLAWAGTLLFVSLLRLGLVAAFRRRDPVAADMAPWQWLYFAVVALTGATWGATTALLALTPSPTHQMFIALCVGGVIVGGLTTNSASLRMFMAFSLPALAPVAAWYLARHEATDIQTATLFIFFGIVVTTSARQFARTVIASLRMRDENRALIRTLSSTNRKLSRSNQNTEALNRLSRLSLESAALEQRLDEAVGIISAVPWLRGTGQGAVFVADETARQLRLFAGATLPPDLRESCRRLDFDNRPCGSAALSRRVEFADTLDGAPGFAIGGMTGDGQCAVPILVGEKLLGVVLLGVSSGLRPGDSEIEFLNACGATLAAVMVRCHADDELRLAASVFDNSLEGIIITDADGNVLKANPAVTTITGYDAAEILGHTPRVWGSGRHEPAFYAELWRSLRESGRWQGEIWNRRKDGALFPTRQTIVSVGGPGRETLRYIGIFRDISDRKRAEDHMRLLAFHDVLTDLPNRRLFEDRLEQAVERARRRDRRVALLIVDLYTFRLINDSLGYRVGDDILRQVAQRLRASVRAEDTVARIGGDAFGIILEDVSDASACEKVAKKLIDAVSAPLALNSVGDFSPACVAGIGIYPNDAADARALITNTDAAMHDAEKLGENRYSFYSARMSAEATERLALERALRHAIDHDQLVLHYQPQYSCRLGRVIGAEALVRWEHPDLGLVPPARFIPLAEETRLILPLSRWVLRRALQQWTELNTGRDPALRLGINVSVHQFQEIAFVATVAAELKAAGVPPSSLELEITESVLLQDTAAAAPRLKQLRDLGVRIALDDFGTGYSSLGYLASLPIDTVKIDRAFIRRITSDTAAGALVRAILQMCRALDLDVVVEGVETTAQYATLREMGVDTIQGFLFGKPVPCELFNRRPPGRKPVAVPPTA